VKLGTDTELTKELITTAARDLEKNRLMASPL
jgi:hypothetical protein